MASVTTLRDALTASTALSKQEPAKVTPTATTQKQITKTKHNLMGFINIYNRLKGSDLAKDSFWALFGNFIGKGLSLIAGIAVARFLGSEVYGEYGIIKSTLIMIAIFSSFGLGITATKFIAETKDKNPENLNCLQRVCYIITLIVSGLIALLVFIFSEPIAEVLEAKHLYSALRISSIAILFNALNTTQIGILSGLKAYKVIAINNIKIGIVTFVLTILLTLFYDFDGAVIALVISLGFNCIINYLSIKKQIPRSKTRNNKKTFKVLVSFSLPVALQESLYSISNWAVSFVLIRLAGYVELGIYSAATQWMSIVLFVPGALRNVALSNFASISDDLEKNHRILNRLLLINFVSTFIPFLFIAILSNWTYLLYGDSYEGLPIVLNILVFTSVVTSLSNIYTQELIAKSLNWFLFVSKLIRDIGIVALTAFLLIYTQEGALVYAISVLVFQSFYLLLLHYKYRSSIK